MSYSINSLKVALGLAVLENDKLDKFQKVSVMEFIQNGTDAQIRHLALTGEVKYKFTLAEKAQLIEKIKSVKLSEGIKNIIKEEDDDYASAKGRLVRKGMEHGTKAMSYVAKKAAAAKEFADQHTGGHGTAAAAIAGGAALAGGAAALLARRRAKQKAAAKKK